LQHGAKLRADIYHAHEAGQILDIVHRFFSHEERLMIA